MRRSALVLMVLIFAGAASAQSAPDKCRAGKNEAAGKLTACLAKAEKKFVLKGDAAAYAAAVGKCSEKFTSKWDKLEQKALDAASSCPDSVTDTEIDSFAAGCQDAIASALAGNPLVADPVSCDSSLTSCEADYDSCSGSLTTCNGSLSSCNSNVATCNAGTAAAGDVLAGKTFSSSAGLGITGTATAGANVTGADGAATFTIPNGFYTGSKTCTATDSDLIASNIKTGKTILGVTGNLTVFPKTGQTTAYGAGSDGSVQAGSALSYTDNGDGTITDNVTGLMWEKKDDSGGIHDKDNGYTWSGASFGGTNVMDGTIATTFLAALNAGGGFAGHTDWRIPNIKELQSIVDYEIPYPGPTVNAAFHKPATCTGCSDVTAATCSCTASNFYWSSSTYRNGPNLAWDVSFGDGFVFADGKDGGYRVRAVRGGL